MEPPGRHGLPTSRPERKERHGPPRPHPVRHLDEAFLSSAPGRRPLAVNGAATGLGLPPRRIPLPELRAVLLHPSTSHPARNAVLALIVRRARREGGPGRWRWPGCCYLGCAGRAPR